MWKKLRILLFFLLSVSFSAVLPCYSEVTLTDEEAQEMMSEMEKSKAELQTLKEESKTELEKVQNISNEQKKYYEERLKEAEKEKVPLQIISIVSGTSSLVLSVVVLILII